MSPEDQTYLRDVVAWHCRYHQRERFLSKTPRNLFRLRALRVVFPKCYIVHLIRDGRAVAASILKRRRRDNGTLDQWWGVRPPGWESIQSRSPTEQAAWTWKKCLERARHIKSTLPEEQYLTVYYEKFVEQPQEMLKRLFEVVGLDTEAVYQAELRRQLQKIYSPPQTWRSELSSQQKEDLRLLEPDLRRLGYIGEASTK